MKLSMNELWGSNQLKSSGTIALIVSILAVTIVLLSFIPLPIPVITDFIMLYVATVGLTQGVNVYDYSTQQMLAQQLAVQFDTEFTYPFYIYPPWLAYSSAFLGWLSPAHAARLWFWVNIFLILGSVYLITITWSRRWWLVAVVVTMLSPAVLGLLTVGQFVAPVLFGIALTIYAATNRSASWYVVGMLLLTFKPHVGIVPFLVAGGWLIYHRQNWQLRALSGVAGALIALLLGTSLIYPTWIQDYLVMLDAFRSLPTFGVCTLCSGGSVLLTWLLFGTPLTSIALYIGLSFIALMALWGLTTRIFSGQFDRLMSWSMLITVLAVPYLNNYDHIVSLLPMLWLLRSARGKIEYLVLCLAFLLPWLGPLTQDRQLFAISLIGQAIILFGFMTVQLARQPLPASSPVAS